jgi:hypothetical protein
MRSILDSLSPTFTRYAFLSFASRRSLRIAARPIPNAAMRPTLSGARLTDPVRVIVAVNASTILSLCAPCATITAMHTPGVRSLSVHTSAVPCDACGTESNPYGITRREIAERRDARFLATCLDLMRGHYPTA